MKNFETLKRNTLSKNCRNNSLEHALRLIETEDKKIIAELGTIRFVEKSEILFDWKNNYSHEGYSTLLFAQLSKIKNIKFHSIDIDGDAIQVYRKKIISKKK
jgi:hypothetical protein